MFKGQTAQDLLGLDPQVRKAQDTIWQQVVFLQLSLGVQGEVGVEGQGHLSGMGAKHPACWCVVQSKQCQGRIPLSGAQISPGPTFKAILTGPK